MADNHELTPLSPEPSPSEAHQVDSNKSAMADSKAATISKTSISEVEATSQQLADTCPEHSSAGVPSAQIVQSEVFRPATAKSVFLIAGESQADRQELQRLIEHRYGHLSFPANLLCDQLADFVWSRQRCQMLLARSHAALTHHAAAHQLGVDVKTVRFERGNVTSNHSNIEIKATDAAIEGSRALLLVPTATAIAQQELAYSDRVIRLIALLEDMLDAEERSSSGEVGITVAPIPKTKKRR